MPPFMRQINITSRCATLYRERELSGTGLAGCHTPYLLTLFRRPGISQEDLPKIFERFYRADAARRSEGGGHGLGLSIARIIVMAHGGKLRVRSKVNVGSTFYVDLPDKQESLRSVRREDAAATP